jgi:hypothetical protein
MCFRGIGRGSKTSARMRVCAPAKTNVELNRYAVGVGERVGVGPRLVSCERDSPAGSGCID